MVRLKRYEDYKDSGLEWMGEVPENWTKRKLTWIFEVIGSGTTPTSSNSDYYDGDIPWLITGDLNDGIIYSTSKTVTDLALAEYSTLKVFPENSLVMAMYGATIGKLGLTEIKTTTNQACCVMARPVNADLRYLFYWLLGNRKEIINLSQGGGQPNISQNIIRSLRIYCPPIDDQVQIAIFLDHKAAEIDSLIADKINQIALLEEQRQAIITEAVTKGLNPNVKMKDSGVEWIGDIPERWEMTKLRYIGEAIIGLTYSPEDVVYSHEGMLVLRSSNVSGGKIVLSDNVYVRKEIPNRLLTRRNDILICSRNGSRDLIGKCALIDEESTGVSFGAFMTVFRSEYNNFLYYVFNSLLFKFQSGSFLTSTINQLTINNLNGFIIALPSKDEQLEIVTFLDNKTTEIDELISNIEIQINKLKEYRQSLIFEAVTGKIDVREVETEVNAIA